MPMPKRKDEQQQQPTAEEQKREVAIPIEVVHNLALQLHALLQTRQLPVALYSPPDYAGAVRNIDLRQLEGVSEELAQNWDAIRHTIPVIADQNLSTFQVVGSVRLAVESVLNQHGRHIQAALEEINVPYEIFLKTPGLVEMVAVMLIALRAADRASRASHLVVPASAIQH